MSLFCFCSSSRTSVEISEKADDKRLRRTIRTPSTFNLRSKDFPRTTVGTLILPKARKNLHKQENEILGDDTNRRLTNTSFILPRVLGVRCTRNQKYGSWEFV